MKFLTKLNVAIIGLAFYGMNALTAIAITGATPVAPPDTRAPIPDANTFINFFNQIATWAAYLFWALTVIFVFYAAFLYLTAAGDEEKIKKANHQLIYAVIAIVVALFAYGLPRFVFNTITSSTCIGSGC